MIGAAINIAMVENALFQLSRFRVLPKSCRGVGGGVSPAPDVCIGV